VTSKTKTRIYYSIVKSLIVNTAKTWHSKFKKKIKKTFVKLNSTETLKYLGETTSEI
jgi:hypothetical protein